MRKIFFLILLCLSLSFFSTIVVARPCDPTSTDAVFFLKDCATGTAGVDPSTMGQGVVGIKFLVIKVAERVLQFGALFAVGAIVWSGVKYTTAYGDDEKIKTAKSTAIYAIIGLVLVLTAFSLVDIFINFIYSFSG